MSKRYSPVENFSGGGINGGQDKLRPYSGQLPHSTLFKVIISEGEIIFALEAPDLTALSVIRVGIGSSPALAGVLDRKYKMLPKLWEYYYR